MDVNKNTLIKYMWQVGQSQSQSQSQFYFSQPKMGYKKYKKIYKKK